MAQTAALFSYGEGSAGRKPDDFAAGCGLRCLSWRFRRGRPCACACARVRPSGWP